jgi:hypothetical protein
MNGPNDPIQPDWNTPKPVAFCQNCGKSLDNDSVRKVGPAVYCEPCLAARLAATPPPASGPAAGRTPPAYGPVNTGSKPADTVWQWGAGMPSGWTPGQGPNPGLAALLGLIPGVGAMYNEQYAKGVAHLLIFAVLVMFSHVSGIFALFVIGWVAFMSIEAHHTAVARRDGTPLPNPFGLNDIGERMGFGKAWPTGPDISAAARDAAETAAAGIGAATAGFNRPNPAASASGTPASASTAGPQPAAASWGAPTDSYAYKTPPAYSAPHTAPAYGAPVYGSYGANGAAAAPMIPPIPPIAPQPQRFPAGAVWLIGLGMFFLLSTLGIFHAVPGSALVGVILLILGVWNFLRRMTDSGATLAYDGTAAYQYRALRALRGSVWLIAIGFLALLDSFRLLSWSYSWPFIIILVGLMMIVQRTVFHSVAAAAVPQPSPAYVEGWDDPPPAAPSPAATSTAPYSEPKQGGM